MISRHLYIWIIGLTALVAARGLYAQVPGQVVINEVLASNSRMNYDADFGQFSDWVELHNPGSVEVDISGWYLSDDPAEPGKWQFPDGTGIPAGDYFLVWADDMDLWPGDTTFYEFTEIEEIIATEYHLNFRISREGEVLILSDADGLVVDSLEVVNQERDFSFGRAFGNAEELVYFDEVTPAGINSANATSFFKRSGNPGFSLEAGFFPGPVTVELIPEIQGSEVRYTTDGSDPDYDSPVYGEPIPVNFSQVIKAREYADGKLRGEVVTKSYIIDGQTNLPVVSISIRHEYLWGFDFGLYQNNLKNREVYAHLEYFDDQGSKAFDINAGLQLFGSQIFQFDQKPFSVFFRNRYGQDTLQYKLFKDKDTEVFHSLVLRNGGNDNGQTMFRDGLGAVIPAGQFDVDYQAYRPVVVYMNGEYWGIFNLREKVNEEYLQENHGVNPDHIDLLEDSLSVNSGDANAYRRLVEYVEAHDLSVEEHYRYISGKIDVDEFMNYMIYKIYGGYQQWQVNNKYWKERIPGSAWRWIAFDMEHCFGGPGGEPYDSNTFQSALNPDAGNAWYTALFRELMTNSEFRSAFLQRTALFLGTTLETSRVSGVVDSLQTLIAGEMEQHITRWNSPVSMDAWNQHTDLLREFTSQRNGYMFRHMMDHFNLPDTARLTIKKGEGGRVVVCSSYISDADSATFTLFPGLPVKLEALPDPGYSFSGWNRTTEGKILDLDFEADTIIEALFDPQQNLLPDTIKNTLHIEDASKPWSATGHVIIPAGDTLVLGPGVEIQMQPGACLVNYGTLLIEGAKSKPIRINVNPDAKGKHFGSGPGKWGGICILEAEGADLAHLVLVNASSGSSYGDYKGAITSINSDISLNSVEIGDVDNPVYCYGGEVQIDSCHLSSSGTGDLVNLRSCIAPVIRNNDLKGNYWEDTDAIDLDSVSGALVEENYIYSFFGPNSDGIDLGEAATGIRIENNVILSCSDKGISVGQGSEVYAKGNIIVDCNQGFGIKDFNSIAHIDQNTLYANRTGIAVFEKNAGNGGGVAMVKNTIISASLVAPVFVDEFSTLSVTYSLSDGEELQGYHNLQANPVFSSPSTLNFGLGEGSPCIDAGTPGEQDPDGTRADIGAYQMTVSESGSPLLITEVMYNPGGSRSGDWLEFFNNSENSLQLSGWVLKGQDPADEFIFPDHLELQPGEYMVVAESADSVAAFSGSSNQITGDLVFGLSSEGELIRIYNNDYKLVHSLRYGTVYPWPDGPDGKGASMELFSGRRDGSSPGAWHASHVAGGTPGKLNSEPTPVTGLYINELMARNDAALADEAGEFDDWFEVYNANPFTVDLAGMHFISGMEELQIKMIPYYNEDVTSLAPGGFALFWADNDPEQGVDHLEFALSAQGDMIGIGQVTENGVTFIDRLEFGIQQPDVAYGRYPDGNMNIEILRLTPGGSNVLVGMDEREELSNGVRIYPNPADQYVIIESATMDEIQSVKLYAVNGKPISDQYTRNVARIKLNLAGVEEGIYILEILTVHDHHISRLVIHR